VVFDLWLFAYAGFFWGPVLGSVGGGGLWGLAGVVEFGSVSSCFSPFFI
jgi:hypothetical protein